MSTLFELIARLIALLLRLSFYALAAVAAFGILLVGVLTLVWVVLRALLTGRKPMPWLIWQQYRSAAGQTRSRWQARAGQGTEGRPRATGADDVVDVEARELPPHHLPPR